MARRFIDGGVAIFVVLNKNHYIVIAGIIAGKPLVRDRLRGEEASYLTLARAKRVGEHRPWVSIIVKVPCHPQVVRISLLRLLRLYGQRTSRQLGF